MRVTDLSIILCTHQGPTANGSTEGTSVMISFLWRRWSDGPALPPKDRRPSESKMHSLDLFISFLTGKKKKTIGSFWQATTNDSDAQPAWLGETLETNPEQHSCRGWFCLLSPELSGCQRQSELSPVNREEAFQFHKRDFMCLAIDLQELRYTDFICDATVSPNQCHTYVGLTVSFYANLPWGESQKSDAQII